MNGKDEGPCACAMLKKREEYLRAVAVEFVKEWAGEPCSGDESNCKHCLALRTDAILHAMSNPGQVPESSPVDPGESHVDA